MPRQEVAAAPRRLARALQRLAAAPRVAAQRYGQVADDVVRRLFLFEFQERQAEGLDVVVVEGARQSMSSVIAARTAVRLQIQECQ